MSEELKPCPFCGGFANLIQDTKASGYKFKVRCIKCYAQTDGSAFQADDYNTSKWNTRTQEEE